MSLSTVLMPEFQEEMKKTRAALAALPDDVGDFTVHAKSMPCAKLACHLAQMPLLVEVTLTSPDVDLMEGKFPKLNFESKAQVLAAFDEMKAQAETALKAASPETFESHWKLSAGDYVVYSGNRYDAYRMIGLNHMIHHRAQLGVNLRLMNQPVPSTYGPSADSK